MKKQLGFYFRWIKDRKHKIFWVLAALLLLSQFSTFVYELARYTTSQGMLKAFDDDAAAAIEVAGRTRWFLDNHWSAYGPLYYRITHTLELLSPLTRASESSHFHLLLTSLLSAYALCFLLVTALGVRGPERLVSMTGLMVAFLSQEVWREMLFRAHPDWLLSLSAAGTLYYLGHLRRSISIEKNHLVLLALFLAFGFLTKATFVFFVPSVLILFLGESDLRPNWRKILGWSLGFYFLIGFPQSFRIDRDLRFLSYQSGYSTSADMASIHEWFELYFTQLWPPLVGMLVIYLLFSQRHLLEFKKIRLRQEVLTLAAAVLPFGLLLTRKISSPHHYYTMPFVAFLLVAIALLLLQLRRFGPEMPRFRSWALGGALLVGCVGGFFTPSAIDAKLRQERPCREQAQEVYQLLEQLFQNQTAVFMDPYVPHPLDQDYKPFWKGSWTNSWEKLKESGADWVVLNTKFYQRYLSSSDYVGVYDKDPSDSSAFYQTFASRVGGEVRSPDGEIYRLQQSYSCGWDIYKKDE